MSRSFSSRRADQVRVKGESGVSIVEYGLVIALFALAVLGGAALLFQGLQTAYTGASNDVGTPGEPTQAPTNPAVPDPTDTEPEPTPTHTPVVAPTLTRTVICSSDPTDVNVRSAVLPIQNATVLVASHPDAEVRDSGRTIRFTPDVPADCGTTATVPYTFSYRQDGVFYSDGTGQLQVTVLPRALAATETLSIWCSPDAVATFDLAGTLSAWPDADVTITGDNGTATPVKVGPTRISYDPVTTGRSSDCGQTRTIDYSFTYVIGGITYTDGRGQLRVVVSGQCSTTRQTLTSPGRFLTVSDDGAADATRSAPINGTNPTQYSELRYTPTAADCGNTVTVSYTYRFGTETRSGQWAIPVRP